MGLFSSHYFSLFRQGLVYAHVVSALLSLVVAPLAMWVQKGGVAHRRWGKLYFWGMFVANMSALVLLVYRFNVFLLGVTVISFYAAIMGYRVLYRKRPHEGRGANWVDWLVTGVMGVVGVWLVVTPLASLVGIELMPVPLSDVPFVLAILPLVFGVMAVQAAVSDVRCYIDPPTDRNYWWYAHMNSMLSSYIGLTTAFMVQQVGPRMPEAVAWLVWVLPAVVGSMGISRWIGHYRQMFEGQRVAVGD